MSNQSQPTVSRFAPVLTDIEDNVFSEIGRLLETLPEPSQLKVLKEVASRYDREVNKRGHVRIARAVASAVSTKSHSASGSQKRKPTPRKAKVEDAKWIAWKKNQGKALISEQAKWKDIVSSRPSGPNETEKASLRKASLAVREAYQLFLGSGAD